VQQASALAVPDDANPRRYQLTGLVICGLCGRRMEGHWAHGRARYRCRHGHTSARDAQPDRMAALYVRDDQILTDMRMQLAHHLGAAPEAITVGGIPERLRLQALTIVCTPVSIILDTGTAEPDEEEELAAGGQLTLPGIHVPHPRAVTKKRPPRSSAET
jgi:site-specific DNA recombinase